jgi:glycine amidinotransferase
MRKVSFQAMNGAKRSFSAPAAPFVVNSHNEFDPLEEVIVGRVDGATIPEWHVSGKAVWPEKWWDMYKTQSGQSFPMEMIKKGTFR